MMTQTAGEKTHIADRGVYSCVSGKVGLVLLALNLGLLVLF